MDAIKLAALIAAVPSKDAVYAEEAPVSEVAVAAAPAVEDSYALTSLAHYVFNTLRGAADTVDGATFDDVRNALAGQGY